MLSYERIFVSPAVRIFEVACSASRGGCGDVETVNRAKVVVPRAGVFSYHFDRDDAFVADANTAVVLRPGRNYKISHPIDGGDRCTIFEYDDDLLGVADGAVPLSAGGALAARIARGAALGNASALAVEEHAMAFVGSLLPFRSLPRHETVERAKEAIAADPFGDRSLTEIAAAVGSSPFHLTRMFRRSTGQSLHAYRTQLRLQHGLERAVAGESLVHVAQDCGFSSHSQFTAAFRQRFGTVPSQLRKIFIAV